MSIGTARLPLWIWVTGEPVPQARRVGGSFADMIRSTAGPAWKGAWTTLDCTADEAVLPTPEQVAGVIVTGSPARIADQLQWMVRVQDGLRRLVEQRVPVLGICFGHQLLGQALGGRSGPNPRGREIGIARVKVLHDDRLLGTAGRCVPACVTHLDVVLDVPPDAHVLASTELDPHAAIRFGEAAWGVQFHPEMDAAIIAGYVESARAALIDEGLDPDSLLGGEAETTTESSDVLRRFCALVAERAHVKTYRDQ